MQFVRGWITPKSQPPQNMQSTSVRLTVTAVLASAVFSATAFAADPYKVLWWDSTPEYGSQAPNALRKEFSDYLNSYNGGSVFSSTFVASETAGTLATHLASNSYDVLVFDATSYSAKFNSSDIASVQNFYSSGKKNLLLDGTLYIRSINYNSTSNFPGVNDSSGKFTVNEVFSIASRGGGIFIGTDHSGFQVDANQILNGILPSASFSGITYPSTDGVFYGSDLLNSKTAVAASDIFNHWDSIDTQAIAATGAFSDFNGASRNLYSQVDVADIIGGPKYSYISTSWKPGSGSTDVTDPNPGGGGGGGNRVPDAAGTFGLFALVIGALASARRFARAA
ncbi:hypothetical protein [Nibricoccus sp. IMCC34717]|uniref:hypothetical protein n=1 Tax=Nibricoccus sp. IMCC34717 TaxID=3034021 RepID=UPI00384A9C7D